MEERLTKEQVIDHCIRVIGGLCIPVALKEQLTDPLDGVMNNLYQVLQMCAAEKEINVAKDHAETKDADEVIDLIAKKEELKNGDVDAKRRNNSGKQPCSRK